MRTVKDYSYIWKKRADVIPYIMDYDTHWDNLLPEGNYAGSFSPTIMLPFYMKMEKTTYY